MARPGLTRHRKFARLARLIGSEVAARGHLELLWDVAYESGDELLGDAGDVEFLAKWTGEAGALASALAESRFLDVVDGEYHVHDLWDHAPDYVRKRRSRESQRREKGARLAGAAVSDRSVTGQRPDGDQPESGQRPPNGRTRTPTPAPTQETTDTSADADGSVLEGQVEPAQEQQPTTTATPEETAQPRGPDYGAQAAEVFAYWRQVMGKRPGELPTKLDRKRRAKVEARLREGITVAQLQRAIDGCRASEWHMGANDRGARFDDLELICRDQSQVAKFIAIADRLGGAAPQAPGALEPEKPCAICGRMVGAIGRRAVGDGVLCVRHAMELDAAPGRPERAAERDAWALRWVSEQRGRCA